METVFISMPKNEFQAFVIDCVKSCLAAQPTIPSSPTIEKPVSLKEACEFANIAVPTGYAGAQKGEFPGHKRNGRWYFYLSEVNEWIKNGGKKTLENNAEESLMAANKRKLRG
jgi:predicted DNA-binding transcriptional regulator AlpA